MKIEKAVEVDLSDLRRICIDAYSLNFQDHWEEGGLDWYLDMEFSNRRLLSDIEDQETDYYFIIHDMNRVGFIKLSNDCISDFPDEFSIELEKMYVLPEFKGKGIGKYALAEIFNIAKEQEKKFVLLSVIDSNASAIAFYEKLGFIIHGKTSLDIPYFKQELKGMHRMVKEIS